MIEYSPETESKKCLRGGAVRMRILTQDTLAIAVDYQEKLIPAIFEKEQIVSNSILLFEGLKELGVPILVTEQYPKGLGRTIEPMTAVFQGAKFFEKTSFSCYETEDAIKAIKDAGRKNIIVTGTETHVCVLQSVIDMISDGFNLIVVSDCVGSRKANDKEYGLKRAAKEGAIITTYEAILFELLRGASSPSFKAISKIVK
jgi:nicotinamidase-related amidase